jgi:hypothetical protein
MAKKKKTDIPKEKDEELSLDDSLNVVRRLSKSNKLNEELDLLKKASATLAKEIQPGFEAEEDEAGGGPSSSEELLKPPGFLEQIGTTAQALGPAGLIALGSAAYFQVDTVVEETRHVQQVAEEKWEEVKLEHPNINWDDPLAGFTTILGVGDIEIDLEPPTPKTEQPTTTSSTEDNPIESEDETEKESEVNNEESQVEESDEPVEEEQEEKPKKKKKGLFGLFGGDDEEEEAEEEAEEETEEPVEEQVEEESEAEESETVEEESSEPEPEAEEEQVEEKPKKKSGGFFSALFGGGDDEESEEPEEQGEEPTQDDTIPEEQTDETEVDEPETEEVAETTTDDSNENSNGNVKKSSGGLFAALFGNDNTEEVDENEVSTDEEPTIELADSGNEEAPPLSDEEVEIAPIDEIDDIKPHSDVMVAETEVDALPEIDDVEIEVVATDSGETFEINLSEMSVDDIEFLSDAFDNGEIEIADIAIDDTIEEVVEQTVIETVLTPIDTGNGEVNVVSPAGPAGNIDWSGIFGPSAPGYDSGDRDATPI